MDAAACDDRHLRFAQRLSEVVRHGADDLGVVARQDQLDLARLAGPQVNGRALRVAPANAEACARQVPGLRNSNRKRPSASVIACSARAGTGKGAGFGVGEENDRGGDGLAARVDDPSGQCGAAVQLDLEQVVRRGIDASCAGLRVAVRCRGDVDSALAATRRAESGRRRRWLRCGIPRLRGLGPRTPGTR